MDAFLYLAAGPSPHGTVMRLHGLPGYEINGDLAQLIRRAGWKRAPLQLSRNVGFYGNILAIFRNGRHGGRCALPA
jgi:hypothetical protein